jgi:DNA end-binding protein Ku
MARPIWKGHISFGLVNIPVALYPAEGRDALDFTLLDRRDRSPVGYRKVNKRTGEAVPARDVVRGFEHARGRYVVVSDEDLARASPERTHRIEVRAFADPAEIPPRYFERPYWLVPLPGQDEPYALFREALRRTGKAAIATVVVRTRESPAAVMAADDALALHVLRYPEELRDPAGLPLPRGAAGRPAGREVDMAVRLVAGMTDRFRPEDFEDRYRAELLAFIRRRARSRAAEPPPPAPPEPDRGRVVDLRALLEQSLRAGGRRARRPAARRKAS